MGLYHIINIEPDAHHVLEVISDDGSYGWVSLEPSALNIPVHTTRHRISPRKRDEHLVLSIYYLVIINMIRIDYIRFI